MYHRFFFIILVAWALKSAADALCLHEAPLVTELIPVLATPLQIIDGLLPLHPPVTWKTTTYPCSTRTTYTTTKSSSTATCTYWPTTLSTASTCHSRTKTVTITKTRNGYPTTTCPTRTTTSTVTQSCASTSSICPTTSPSGKPFSCIPQGYISSTNKLLAYDLDTGEYRQIATTQTTSGNINALGYNIQDNFLYGNDGSSIVRVHVDGTIDTIVAAASGFRGDVDGDSYYWYIAGSSILQIDINPSRSTYTQTISTTPANTLGVAIYDYAYIPIAGQFFYAVGQNTDGGTSLIRFNMFAKVFELVATYNNIRTNNGFGEHFGSNNGNLYALDDNTGDFWRFPVPLLSTGGIVGQPERIFGGGPTFVYNDGARCSLNTLT